MLLKDGPAMCKRYALGCSGLFDLMYNMGPHGLGQLAVQVAT